MRISLTVINFPWAPQDERVVDPRGNLGRLPSYEETFRTTRREVRFIPREDDWQDVGSNWFRPTD